MFLKAKKGNGSSLCHFIYPHCSFSCLPTFQKQLERENMRRLGYKQRMFLRIGKLGSRRFTLGSVEMGNKMKWEGHSTWVRRKQILMAMHVSHGYDMTEGQSSSYFWPPRSKIVPWAFSIYDQLPSCASCILKSTSGEKIQLTQHIMNPETMRVKQAMLMEDGKGASREVQLCSLHPNPTQKGNVSPFAHIGPNQCVVSMTISDWPWHYEMLLLLTKKNLQWPLSVGLPHPLTLPRNFALSPLFFSSFFFFFYCWIYKILWNMLFPDVGPKCPVIYFPSKQWADEITQVRLLEYTFQRLH